MASTKPTHEEYKQYGGKLETSDFEGFVDDAAYTASMFTFTRSENPPDIMVERVKRCICELVDVKHAYSLAEQQLPRGIGSVTNDGYSVSRNARNSSVSAETSEQQDYAQVCIKYLTAPVNLMYAGVMRC